MSLNELKSFIKTAEKSPILFLHRRREPNVSTGQADGVAQEDVQREKVTDNMRAITNELTRIARAQHSNDDD